MPTYSDVFSGRDRYTQRYVVTQGTQDVANNRTLVSWSVRIDETTENGSWTNATASWRAYLYNGNKGSGTFTYDFRNYDSLSLGSGSVWIPHAANGTRTVTVAAEVWGNTVIGNAYSNDSLGLTTIPRKSTPSWASGGTKYIGSTYSIHTNRASTGFLHTITYQFGSKSGTIGTNVGGVVSWAIPADLIEAIPDKVSGTARIYTDTFSGGTLVGSTAISVTLTAAASVVPDFTTITHTEATAGVAANVGAYVQGVSTLAMAITGASGIGGSTIESYKISVAGQAINSVSGTSTPINASGTVAITGTVTDSRGRSKSKTINVTFMAYEPPKIITASVQRSLAGGTPNEEGTYLRVNINASVQSLINGTQRNALRYKVSTRLKDDTLYTVKINTPLTAVVFNGYVNIGTYSITESYDVLIEVIDDFSTSVRLMVVPVAKIFMHWDGTDGVGIGKYREQGALDVQGDIYSSNDIYSSGDVFLGGSKALTEKDLLVQWGSAIVTGDGDPYNFVNVSFDEPYASPPNILTGAEMGGSVTNTVIMVTKVTNVTTTGFSLQLKGSVNFSSSYDIPWVAFGKQP